MFFLRRIAKVTNAPAFRFEIKPGWQVIGFHGHVGGHFHRFGVIVSHIAADFRKFLRRLPVDLRRMLFTVYLIARRFHWHDVSRVLFCFVFFVFVVFWFLVFFFLILYWCSWFEI